jgi:hypothetical protein
MGRLYGFLLTTSIVTRWLLFIIPVLALFWIPGILALTTYPHASVSRFLLPISYLADDFRYGVLGCCGGVSGSVCFGRVRLSRFYS